MERIGCALSGTAWTPTDFLDLAERATIDKALQRLVHAGTLRRITRGIYDKPQIDKLSGAQEHPDPHAVVDAIARRDGIRVLVDDVTAARDLGFTDQISPTIIVHSEARSRSIQIGDTTITFKPTAPSKLVWAGRPAMRIVQAIRWLHANGFSLQNEDIAYRLRELIAEPGKGPTILADLTAGLLALPAWMREELKPFLVRKYEPKKNAQTLPPGPESLGEDA